MVDPIVPKSFVDFDLNFDLDLALNLDLNFFIPIIFFCGIYPILEELVFRGALFDFIQGHLTKSSSYLGISSSNLLVSLIFASAHLIHHSLIWSLAIVIPSLALGHIKESYQHLGPSIGMHIYFNSSLLVFSVL